MPELILRIRRTTAPAAADGSSRDVVVTVEPSHTVAELAAALAAPHGRRSEPVLGSTRTGEVFDPSSPVDRLDLLSGDELVVGDDVGAVRAVVTGARATDRAADEAADQAAGTVNGPAIEVVIDVVAGPDTSSSFRVRRPGRYAVGRAPGNALRLGDPAVSRRHLTVEVDRDGRAIVHPMRGAANGVRLNGDELSGPVAVAPTDLLTIGGTRLVVRAITRQTEASTAAPSTFGRVDFHRTPYRPPVIAARPTEPVGPIPERAEPRRLPTVAVAAPLVAGLAMYLLTRQLQFLALTLLSPVIMIGSVIEDRRSGRRATRDRVARFRRDLADQRDRFERLRQAERVERFRAAPDLADLARRAQLRTVDLWARGRAAPDFLTVRLGLGSATVRFAVELERGGADDLRDEAVAALRGLDTLAEVPVAIPLDSVFAVHGETGVVDGVASALVVQAATLHSPEDLVIAAALAPERPLAWVRWLPHARSVTSPLSGDHVARTSSRADLLVERLVDVAEQRCRATDGSADRTPPWPKVMVVLDAGVRPDPTRVARLLDLAPAAGVAVVWLARTASEVPRQAARTLRVRRGSAGSLRGRLWSTDPATPEVELEVEHLAEACADRVARALAPVHDASTMSRSATIPRTAPLLGVLGVGRPSAAWVVEHWTQRREGGLRFPIGLGADGPVELDLVEDGPHALVGGTSGAGKSELLQSMVAALAVHHPPTRLNFLFVDYKGGASTQVFERLAHTVGHVTNLSADLAARALTSLQAELHRRMALLEGRAKDLAEFLALAPDEAPPALVIVVDEFATLVREIPEFVTGIVDIAQRGRSLGIHLVLATQRPSGSVNENILANTNLRISLRMLDRAESTAVVGVPDAADIPVPLRGRGIVRLGPRRFVEFQSAFGGAPLLAAALRPEVRVRPFDATVGEPVEPGGRPAGTGEAPDGTQLDAVLAAVAEADRRLALPPPRRPWRDVLPDVLPLHTVAAEVPAATPARFVTIGLLDAPERQEQRPAVLDLDDGGVLAFGSGGAGATTLLRTVAASVVTAAAATDARVAVVVFDAGGRGCARLAALPDVDVVPVDDLEAVTRHLVVLERELDRRRAATGDTANGDDAPRIVLLVDDLGALIGALLDVSVVGDDWVARLVRVIVDGRQVGIHTVATASRRGAVPARVHAAVANRFVLRHTDESASADHGVPAARTRGLSPGRGLWLASGRAEPVLVQIATVSTDPSARAQATALADLGSRLAPDPSRPRPEVLRSAPLAERDGVAPDVAPPGLVAAIGRTDITGAPALVDLEWSHLAVSGPPRSGRSNALAVVASQLAGRVDPVGRGVVVVGPASSPLRRLAAPGLTSAFGRAVASLLRQVAPPGDAPWVLVLDDLDALDDPELLPLFEQLARDDSVRIVAAMEPRIGFTTNPLVPVARRARRHLVLQPDDPAEFLQLTGTRLAIRPGLRMPPGRGVLLVDRVATVVHVTDALPPGEPGCGDQTPAATTADRAAA